MEIDYCKSRRSGLLGKIVKKRDLQYKMSFAPRVNKLSLFFLFIH